MTESFATGWAIFMKSMTQIIYNLTDAVKISGPLWVLIYVLTALAPTPGTNVDGIPEFSLGGALFILVSLIAIFCGFCWVAILWHRFMLLNEGSDNLVAKWNGRRVWNYFKSLFVIGLTVLIIAGIPYMFIVFMLGGILLENPQFALIFGLIISVFFYYLSLRFGLVLPSVALEKRISLGDSYTKTASCNGAIIVASILLVSAAIIVGQLLLISRIDQYTFQLPSFIVNWFFTMTGISILTTLYGFLIENRELS